MKYSGAGQRTRDLFCMPWVLRLALPFTVCLVLIWLAATATTNLNNPYIANFKTCVSGDRAMSTDVISQDSSDPLAFRRRLEEQYAGFTYKLGSSATFTFDNIYVLSLAKEKKRQQRVHDIARALGMRYEIFTATGKDEPIISWISNRVKEVRDVKGTLLAKAWNITKESIGGMGIDSP